MGALAAGMTGLALFSVAAPAQAEEPGKESRTVITNLVDHPDHGNGTPEVWALDTFARTFEITGGPEYVRHPQPSFAADEAELEVPADIDEQVAEAKKEPDPEFNVCDLVKQFRLRWEYHAVAADEGTFKTLAGATRSPEAGAALLGDVPGTLVGGFSANFTAPAHWCSFDTSWLDGTISNGKAPRSSEWVQTLFGDKAKGDLINNDWTWTYTTCSEEWMETGDGNTGDITGKPCATPSPSPSTTPPPVVVNSAQLPVTGASVSTVVAAGAGMVLLGIAMLGGLALSRRRQQA